jgi:hypothetical protein
MRLVLSISHKSSWLNSVFFETDMVSERALFSLAREEASEEGTPEETKSS